MAADLVFAAGFDPDLQQRRLLLLIQSQSGDVADGRFSFDGRVNDPVIGVQ